MIMKHKLKLSIIFLVSSILIGTIACSQNNQTTSTDVGYSGAEASWAYGFTSIEEMANDSRVDLIVAGEIDGVIGVEKEEMAKRDKETVYIYFTDYSFKIDRVLKGDEIKEIVIHQTGAEGEEESIITQDPLFQPGEQYLLFLHEYEDGKAFVAGGPDGRFRIIDDTVYSMHHFLSEKIYPLNNGITDIDGTSLDDFLNSVLNKIQ